LPVPVSTPLFPAIILTVFESKRKFDEYNESEPIVQPPMMPP
jgi:hypothetical protein